MQDCLCLSHYIYGHTVSDLCFPLGPATSPNSVGNGDRFMRTSPSFSLYHFLMWPVVKKELEWDEQ